MSGTSFFDFHERVSGTRRAKAEPTPAVTAAAEPLTVSQLTHKIDGVIKAGLPGTVLVKGEVSNFKLNASSGHCYFTLKDAKACLNCVMWRSDAARLRFDPRDGMELLATGSIGVYGQQGRYQLYATRLEPLGQGALELAFRQLTEKLEREGLFDEDRKRPIPAYPSRIAIVTSREAAALHDVLKVLRRFRGLHLMLYPVPVQGDGAAAKIAAAIDHLGRCHARVGGVDVILLARGGGSLEDLWAFNEEVVARAVAASPIPIVTGIGHEVDTSIADLVADHHAHTPTEAAQVIVRQWKTAKDDVEQRGIRLRRELRNLASHARERLAGIERHEAFRRPLNRINSLRQLLDDRQRELDFTLADRLGDARRRLGDAHVRLEQHRPELVLGRLRQRVADIEKALATSARTRTRAFHDRLQRLVVLLGECHPKHQLRFAAQRLDQLDARLRHAGRADQRHRHERLAALAAQLQALSPEAVLKRGYSITTMKKSGAVVRRSADVRPGERLVTRFADGSVESTAEDSRQLPLFE